jgi:multiple sugar transport system substrate-binding protein
MQEIIEHPPRDAHRGRTTSRRTCLRWALLAGPALALSACGGAATVTATTTTAAVTTATGTPSSATVRATTASAVAATDTAAVAASAATGVGKKPLALQIWQSWGGDTDPRTEFNVQHIFPAFMQAYPGVTLQQINEGDGTAPLEKINANLAAGTPPDVAYVQNYWTVGLGVKGAIIALDDLIARTKGFDKGDYYPHLWEALTYQNKIWAFPQYNHPFGVYYRTDLFDRFGAQPAKTWDDFLLLAQKINHIGDGQYALDMGMGDTTIWDTVQRSNGGAYLSSDGSKVAWASQAGQDALDYLKGFFTKYQLVPAKSIKNGFQGAKIAMTISGPYRVNGYVQQKLPVLSSPFPKGKVADVAHADVNAWAIFKTDSDHEQAAFDFVSFSASTPTFLDFATHLYYVPLTKSLAALPAYQKFVADNPIMAAFLDPSVQPIVVPLTPVGAQLDQILKAHLMDAESGKVDTLTALKAAETEANAQLSQGAT